MHLRKLNIITCFILVTQVQFFAQVAAEFNANIDLEASYMSENSHYWKNEIHSRSTGFRVDIPEMNLTSKVTIKKQWNINARLWTFRELGKRPGILKDIETYSSTIAQINVQWTSKSAKSKITIGRFNNGYGNFTRKQISNQRNFIYRPLFYSFFVNASDLIGVAPRLGEGVKINLGERIEWGSAPIYYGGYSNGINYRFGHEGGTTYSISFVSGTPNKLNLSDQPLSPTIISRIGWQPRFDTKIAWSMLFGSFMKVNENISFDKITQYRQFVTGIDFEYGTGYFEISGELNSFYYNLPSINFQDEIINFYESTAHLFGISPFLDLKYESPKLSGFFAAVRLETMLFFNSKDGWEHEQKWEDDLFQIGIGLGYKIHKNIQVRANASFQRHFEQDDPINRSGIRALVTFFI